MRIVGGSRRGRKLQAPPGRELRPTADRVREALFNVLEHRDFGAPPLRGTRVAELFAGTGALGLEGIVVGTDQRGIGRPQDANGDGTGTARVNHYARPEAQSIVIHEPPTPVTLGSAR